MFPPLGQRLFYLKVNLKKALNIGCVPCLTPQDSPWGWSRDMCITESGWCHSLSHNFSLYFLHSRISCSVISELYSYFIPQQQKASRFLPWHIGAAWFPLPSFQTFTWIFQTLSAFSISHNLRRSHCILHVVTCL